MPQGHLDQAQALADLGAVPLAAVLLGEQQQPPIGCGAGVAAGVGEQDEREQPGDRGLAGEQQVQHAGQVEGALGEIATLQGFAGRGGVPGGEQQVDDVSDRG